MSDGLQRLESIKRRVRDHQGRRQQLEGRRQSLTEQKGRYEAELEKVGLTPEQLPGRIQQLDQQLGEQLEGLETVLTAAGA